MGRIDPDEHRKDLSKAEHLILSQLVDIKEILLAGQGGGATPAKKATTPRKRATPKKES